MSASWEQVTPSATPAVVTAAVLVSGWVVLVIGLCNRAVGVAVGRSGVAMDALVVGVGAWAATTTLVAGSLSPLQAASHIDKVQAIIPSRHDNERFNGSISSLINA